MSDLAAALMQALGIGKNAPPQAPPNMAKDPWNDPSLAAPPVKPQMAAGGMGGAVAQGGSRLDEIDALLAEIKRQKQMGSVLGGQLPPG